MKSYKFKLGKGMRAAYFVNKETFTNTAFTEDEEPIKEHIDKIWLPVEKTPENQ